VGTIAAAIAGGAFEPMKIVLAGGAIATFVLLILGALLSPWKRTGVSGRWATRCAMVTLFAIPASFVAARGVVAFEVWRAKGFIESHLLPQLERKRRAEGEYPRSVALPPRLEGWNYVSDGRAYSLSMMDPGVCGRVTSYASTTRQWTEMYDPCWY
jgi:hypothetical protein